MRGSAVLHKIIKRLERLMESALSRRTFRRLGGMQMMGTRQDRDSKEGVVLGNLQVQKPFTCMEKYGSGHYSCCNIEEASALQFHSDGVR